MEIKHCPICGCVPVVKDSGEYRISQWQEDPYVDYTIECCKCGISASSLSYDVAVSVWNGRVDGIIAKMHLQED